MPAYSSDMVVRAVSRSPSSANSEVRSQWRNPSDILSLLLLVGGEVIQQAIAQLAGDPYLPTPVVFSFGWVAYTFKALLSAVGDNKLMPSVPDLQSVIIDMRYGHVRANQSWILGRILRDFEHYWMPEAVCQELEGVLKKANSPKAGLCISVFEADPKGKAGRPTRDLLWMAGYVVAFVQLIIAAIPWILWKNWEIFAITISGTVLAFISSSLPQWRLERYACRRDSTATTILTRGNGAQHALVIQANGCGLNLEDLAGATEANFKTWTTRPAITVLSVLWVGLLITVSGIKDDSWFLVAVGALGMVFTVVVAGLPRKPEAFGIPLLFKAVIVESQTMEALKKVEQQYRGVGQSLVGTFFPGELRKEDVSWWAEAKEGYKSAT